MPFPASYPDCGAHGIFSSHWAVIAAMAKVVNEGQRGSSSPFVLGNYEMVAMVRSAASVFLIGGTEHAAISAASCVVRSFRDGEGTPLGRHLKVGTHVVDAWPSTGAYGIFSSHAAVVDALAMWIPVLQGSLWNGKERGQWAVDAMDGMLIAAANSLKRFGDDTKATDAAYQHFVRSRRTYFKRFGTAQAEVAS